MNQGLADMLRILTTVKPADAARSPRAAWALPRFTPACGRVVRRHLQAWRARAATHLLGNLAEPVSLLLAFGYGLGALIGPVEGLPYVSYLASGGVVLSCALTASVEALYPAFDRMRPQGTWDGILLTPIGLDDIVLAELLWAALKSMVSLAAMLAVLTLLGIGRAPTLWLAVPLLAFVSLVFASMALAVCAACASNAFFTHYLGVLMAAMSFVSGVYFPVSTLPEPLQAGVALLPLNCAVELVRPLVLGHWPAESARPLAVLATWALVCGGLALVLARRRMRR
jgi:lipooligosaccharide transport system permease protein